MCVRCVARKMCFRYTLVRLAESIAKCTKSVEIFFYDFSRFLFGCRRGFCMRREPIEFANSLTKLGVAKNCFSLFSLALSPFVIYLFAVFSFLLLMEILNIFIAHHL